MLCFGSSRIISLRALVSSRTFFCRLTSPIFSKTRSVSCRAFSVTASSRDNLFEYTSGRWVINDALRHAERRLVFDVEGLRQLAAQSAGQSSGNVIDLSKLAEGGFNRTFLITFRDGFQMVARIPYPATVPKFYAVASEVATMEFLRLSGLPVPQIYGYSPVSENAAKTEYIFMEYMRGTKLSDIWMDLGNSEISSIMRQLAELEFKLMSVPFPIGGSLYHAHDLKERTMGKAAIPLKDDRFCIGPDTRLPMWYGRRSQLDVDRGPYENAEAALVAAAYKELAYLEEFGQPLLPFRRERRDGYQYQEQSPLAHIENLKRYLLIAPSFIPRDSTLSRFSIRHPDLQPSNIIVRRSPEFGWQVVSLLDWQHASILPAVLLTGVPQRFQNHDDPVSQSMIPPSLPDNLDELDEAGRAAAEGVYHSRLVHYHYVRNTEEYNKPHYDAMTDHTCVLRRRLFEYASNPWEGETVELKVALIEATESWKVLAGEGTPCPIAFDPEDVHETRKLNEVQRKADKLFDRWQNMLGLGPEGWVPVQHYEEAVALCKRMKQMALAHAETEEERAQTMTHWPWEDMDEEKYM